MRQYVAEGFAELLGKDNIISTHLEIGAHYVNLQKPNLVLVFGSCMPDSANYYDLRRSCDQTGATLAFWLHDDPYEFDFSYRVEDIADVIFSNDRWATQHYNHRNVHHLPMAASKAAHLRPISDEKDIDILFCGVAFPNRIRLMKDLAPIIKKYHTVVLGDQWPSDAMLAFTQNRRVNNSELVTLYGRAKITLNIGRNFHLANRRYMLDPSTPGPRTFEAAASGTVQACFVEGLEIVDYYKPGSEIEIFSSPDEFDQLLDRHLNMPETNKQIATAAQERTIRHHLYKHRAQQILKAIGVSYINKDTVNP